MFFFFSTSQQLAKTVHGNAVVSLGFAAAGGEEESNPNARKPAKSVQLGKEEMVNKILRNKQDKNHI